ncbi:phosphoribosylformylglycinamidine cyclo-ligase [Pelagicoccus mobilis]|uniref:Phosphoribosylformylglycinamidine cyclo-ligase n=1 Tax=Pelagicoccus mobilis TaxID=415221 RepID=A0A934S3V9_9BACT|nr:phosphoribosylformylglycinamidine cyclo-ligase [Pelagicoccus mobilis]MBK1878919.1 phosphoribosylformylglycinamidine cyclo-ligase [Pelagicoccus mobilis]
MPAKKKTKAYAAVGVNIDLADRMKGGLKESLKSASRPEVLGAVGGFGGLFDLSKSKYKEPVLVSSIDGVGTKLKLAFQSGKHKSVGLDIVNHCIDDISVIGAEPLFFLDYLGLGKLEPKVFKQLLAGISEACASANCALIGGETAQLPDMYSEGEYDIAGVIVGVAEKKKMLSGSTIRPGDVVIGLPSSGLHTNGYTLARKVIFDQAKLTLKDKVPGTRQTVEKALMAPHTNYAPLLQPLLAEFNKGRSSKFRKDNAVFGIAHITGGGFTGNIPRILPEKVDVEIDTTTWEPLPIFKLIGEKGGIDFDEMYEVFNMGIGMTLVVDGKQADDVLAFCHAAGCKAVKVGQAVKGTGKVSLKR